MKTLNGDNDTYNTQDHSEGEWKSTACRSIIFSHCTPCSYAVSTSSAMKKKAADSLFAIEGYSGNNALESKSRIALSAQWKICCVYHAKGRMLINLTVNDLLSLLIITCRTFFPYYVFVPQGEGGSVLSLHTVTLAAPHPARASLLLLLHCMFWNNLEEKVPTICVC